MSALLNINHGMAFIPFTQPKSYYFQPDSCVFFQDLKTIILPKYWLCNMGAVGRVSTSSDTDSQPPMHFNTSSQVQAMYFFTYISVQYLYTKGLFGYRIVFYEGLIHKSNFICSYATTVY